MPGKRKGKMAAPAAKQNGTRKRKAAKAAEPADDEVDGEIHEEEGEEDESESEEENLDMAEAEGQPTELQASLATQPVTSLERYRMHIDLMQLPRCDHDRWNSSSPIRPRTTHRTFARCSTMVPWSRLATRTLPASRRSSPSKQPSERSSRCTLSCLCTRRCMLAPAREDRMSNATPGGLLLSFLFRLHCHAALLG